MITASHTSCGVAYLKSTEADRPYRLVNCRMQRESSWLSRSSSKVQWE